MQLVEQHVIGKQDSRYHTIDAAAFASKNLYNLANYHVRQSFIFQGKYLGYVEVFHLVKKTEAYKALPAKVANEVLRLLDKNWKAFFKAIKAWRDHPEKFLGHPKLPKYKDKTKGRSILIYDMQALSKRALRQGVIQPSKLGIEILTKQQHIDQVRIVPRGSHYVLEVVYQQQESPQLVNPELVAGIDMGVDNLATLTSNKPGFVPVLVNGRVLKSINQGYNKQRAHLQSKLKDNRYTSRHLEQITDKRNRRVKHLLHSASRFLIDLLVEEGIGTLVIGNNPNWKQEVTMGKHTNQNFVSIPHARFIKMLTYKAKLVGIEVMVTEESYTSKCSFLDHEPISKQEQYAGKRVKRGLFRASDGRAIHADVNGSYNIIRKVLPDAFGKGIVGVAVHPRRIAV